MKHVFLINPAAGKDRHALKLIPEIEEYFAKNPGDYEIYITKAKMDAADYVHRQAVKGEKMRFYACGGDGTLMEVLGGAFGYENVQIACIPCGSANDYIRMFGGEEAFLSIAAQVNGTVQAVDAIDCNGRISLNICSIGMDADVGDKMIYFKNFPLVSGPMAYDLAVLYMFFHHIGRRLHVTIETQNGTVEQEGDYLFALAANGQYYGGGYHGAPQARLNDGRLDCIFIDTIKRIAVPGFLKQYKAGKHLNMPIVHTYQGQRMKVSSDRPVTVCADGECFSDKEVTFELRPKSVQFVLPQGVSLPVTQEAFIDAESEKITIS